MLNKPMIIEVPNFQTLQKARVLVFNRFNVDIYGITSTAKDTEFTYHVYTDKKLSKSLLYTLHIYINGIIDTIKSY